MTGPVNDGNLKKLFSPSIYLYYYSFLFFCHKKKKEEFKKTGYISISLGILSWQPNPHDGLR
jgi:hypothetical protein